MGRMEHYNVGPPGSRPTGSGKGLICPGESDPVLGRSMKAGENRGDIKETTQNHKAVYKWEGSQAVHEGDAG